MKETKESQWTCWSRKNTYKNAKHYYHQTDNYIGDYQIWISAMS